jgi:SAM-dependent methyltransferase
VDAFNAGIGRAGYHLEHYGDRDWRFYGPVLSYAFTYSLPGPILDLGAGHGLLVECARRWGLDCVGVEGSAEAIALGATRGVDLTQCALSSPLPFADEHFRTVFMNQVIEHLEPPVAHNSLNEAWRVLRPGGMIYVASPSRFNARMRLEDPTHINLLAPGELHAMLRDARFVDLRPFDRALYGRGGEMLFHRVHWDRLSATANCIAFKPR